TQRQLRGRQPRRDGSRRDPPRRSRPQQSPRKNRRRTAAGTRGLVTPETPRMAGLTRKSLVVVGLSAVIVAGWIWAGRWARDWLDRRGHFDIALADIQCPVPPGLTRAQFLSEVQYLGGLPDRISTVEPTILLRLADAFQRHPWV